LTSDTTTVLRDVVFAERIGFRPLTLDLHRPAGDPAPVIVFVHGGGWRLGSRRMFTPGLTEDESFGRIVGAGFAVASIDYRLSGEARFPAPLDDVVDAIARLRANGEQWGVRADRIVLWGESSGAHLAALAAMRPEIEVAGVVDWYGPADLTALGRHLHPDDPLRFDADPDTREAGLLGGPVRDRQEEARRASPALQARRGLPPFHIAHGETDDLVPIAQSEALAGALAWQGVEVEFVRVPGASHFWRGAADVGTLFDQALAFAARVASPR
jgi:acetyl esterase/lipase